MTESLPQEQELKNLANCLIINLPERASLPHVRNLPEKLRRFTLQKTLEVDHEVHHEGT